MKYKSELDRYLMTSTSLFVLLQIQLNKDLIEYLYSVKDNYTENNEWSRTIKHPYLKNWFYGINNNINYIT